jgi:hypothetical protein
VATLSCPVADGKLRCKDKKGKTIVFLSPIAFAALVAIAARGAE